MLKSLPGAIGMVALGFGVKVMPDQLPNLILYVKPITRSKPFTNISLN